MPCTGGGEKSVQDDEEGDCAVHRQEKVEPCRRIEGSVAGIGEKRLTSLREGVPARICPLDRSDEGDAQRDLVLGDVPPDERAAWYQEDAVDSQQLE